MNKSDLNRNAYLLYGSHSQKGYMRWFHSFCGTSPQTGERRVFFIEYLIMNPELGADKPILGQLPFHKKRGIRPSYLMLKAGAFAGDFNEAVQLNAYYPLTDLKIALHPLIIQFGENFYSEQKISGYVEISHEEARRRSHMSDEGYMEWNLEVHKSIACHTGYLASPVSNILKMFENFWHAEGIKTQYRGTVTLNGVPYEVTPQDSFGYADKHWGRSFNRPWLQLASCDLTSETSGKPLKHSAIALNGCYPRFLCFPLKRKLLIQLTYENEDYEFNFSPFARDCKLNLKYTNKRLIWQLVAQNKNAVLKLTCSSLRSDLIPLGYESPDGNRPENLQGGGNGSGKLLLYRKTKTGKELIDTICAEHILHIQSDL